MKRFVCGAVVPDCTATFSAEGEDELLTQVADHAQREHGIGEIPPELLAQVRAHIKDA